jgi:acyl carrier protein
MTYSEWESSIRSKTRTSWNLHSLLPKNLDFFILLSSLSGIVGTIGQANYAAGNSYQDSLAYYRTSHGQKAVAIDLGLMSNIGIVAENETFRQKRHDNLISSIAEVSEEELLALLDIYCDPNLEILPPSKSQVLVGLMPPASHRSHVAELPSLLKRRMFAGLSQAKGDPIATDHTTQISLQFRQASSIDQKRSVAIAALTHKLEHILSISAKAINVDKSLFEYGVDSLVAVELRNWIGKEFGANISVFDLMGGTKIAEIGEYVVTRTNIGQAAP